MRRSFFTKALILVLSLLLVFWIVFIYMQPGWWLETTAGILFCAGLLSGYWYVSFKQMEKDEGFANEDGNWPDEPSVKPGSSSKGVEKASNPRAGKGGSIRRHR